MSSIDRCLYLRGIRRQESRCLYRSLLPDQLHQALPDEHSEYAIKQFDQDAKLTYIYIQDNPQDNCSCKLNFEISSEARLYNDSEGSCVDC